MSPSEIELVGHSGRQSPQAVHSSDIFIAMLMTSLTNDETNRQSYFVGGQYTQKAVGDKTILGKGLLHGKDSAARVFFTSGRMPKKR
jgi:hypothetical protein